jgi:putative two-component system response regulator
MSFLMVDDSRSSLIALRNAVRRFSDNAIETFTNPLEALARSREASFDIVLVDYIMPEMNGVEFIRSLRRQASYRNVPVIMVTSQTERRIRLDALKAGATDFLNKPFDPMELKARISNLLALRQAQLELTDRARALDLACRRATEQADIREQEIVWCLAQAMAL